MAKIIYSGLEDSGKSYKLAQVSVDIAYRNAKWLKITGVPRPIVSNLQFGEAFYKTCTEELGIPIHYWKDIEELTALRDCDLIVDEVGTYFDSRTYKDLPLDVRLWLAQASKLGVDIYGSAQDFAQVDLAFRRLTTELHHITKVCGSRRPTATRPPVKRIWGFCLMRQLDPVAYDEETKKFSNTGLPNFFFIRRSICVGVFDTTKRIPKSAPVPFKHVVRPCAEPNCKFELYEFHEGKKHKVLHV